MYGFDYGLIFIIPITLILLLPFGMIGKKRKYPVPYYICLVIGIIYIHFMISYAFFPIDFMDIPEFSIHYNINLKPDLIHADKIHLLLNILLTVPLGIGIQFVTNITNKQRAFVIFILTIAIELLQLVILVVFKPIDLFFDVNDIICNCLGGFVGLGLMMLVNRTFKDSPRKNNNKLLGYIANVCINCGNGKQSLSLELDK